MKLTREELRDELWDAMVSRQDIDVSLTDMADACLARMDEIGIEAVVSGLLARIEASGHDRETGRDREATKAGSAPNPTQQIGN